MTWAQILKDVQPDTATRTAGLRGDVVLERVGLSANVVYRFTSRHDLRLVHSTLRDAAFVTAGVNWAGWLELHGASVSVALEGTTF